MIPSMISKTSSLILKIHPKDNIVVALCDLNEGLTIQINDSKFKLVSNVASKHKFSIDNLNIGDSVFMYGVVVGKAIREIQKGESITTFNISHQTESYELPKFKKQIKWEAPNSSDFLNRTFLGYHRDNGAVGTENNWLVIPLVFCQNRNIETLQQTILNGLGYENSSKKSFDLTVLINKYKSGASESDLMDADVIIKTKKKQKNPLFPNVDGIYFLSHDGGCGGSTSDPCYFGRCSFLWLSPTGYTQRLINATKNDSFKYFISNETTSLGAKHSD